MKSRVNRRDFLIGSAAAGTIGSAAAGAGAVIAGTPPPDGKPKRAMKITEVQVYLVSVGGRHPVLARVLTDEGVSGVGEAAIAYGIGATAAAGMIKDLAQEFLLGKDPFLIEALWSEMYDHTFWSKGGGPIVFAGISALEQALWDIKGKCLGVPIYEMLGGKMRDQVRLRQWVVVPVSIADFARESGTGVKDGYSDQALSPGFSGMDDCGHIRHVSRRSVDRRPRSASPASAVRSAVGPQIDIMWT
jgi:galactonate dehydratase